MGINVQENSIILSNSDVRKMIWLIFATSLLVIIFLLSFSLNDSPGVMLESIIEAISLNFEILLLPLLPIFTGAILYFDKEKRIEINWYGVSFSILEGKSDYNIHWKDIKDFKQEDTMVRFTTPGFEEEITIIPRDFTMRSDTKVIEDFTTKIADFIQSYLE